MLRNRLKCLKCQRALNIKLLTFWHPNRFCGSFENDLQIELFSREVGSFSYPFSKLGRLTESIDKCKIMQAAKRSNSPNGVYYI